MIDLNTLEDFEGYREICDPVNGCFATKRVSQNFGCPDFHGYRTISLHLKKSGRIVTQRLHRAIFQAVTGKLIPRHLHVMHMNSVRSDNRICNLQLGTASTNNLMKTDIAPRELSNKKMAIFAIDANGNRTKFESHSACAKALGGCRPTIGKILDSRPRHRYYKHFWGNGKMYTIVKA